MRKRSTTLAVTIAICGFCPKILWAHIGSGIATSGGGEVYVADTIRDRVWRIDAGGRISQVATNIHTNRLALLEDGQLYVVEERVKRLLPADDGSDPQTSMHIESGAGPVSMDAVGNVYLLKVDFDFKGQNQILKRTPLGEMSVLAGGERGYADGKGTKARFIRLNSFVCAPDGSLYVRDGNYIRRVAPDGTVSTLIGGQTAGYVGKEDQDLQRPLGLAVDASGNLYVAHYWKRRVFRITPAGEVSSVYRTTWPWIPTGVTVANGSVYVLERLGNPYDLTAPLSFEFLAGLIGNPRVRRVSPDGVVVNTWRIGGGQHAISSAILAGIASMLAYLSWQWRRRRTLRGTATQQPGVWTLGPGRDV